ncbi:hypothetical protein BZA77DRAFT_364449 [Pyronema omphalodes]|nr:hypothetical protein BZA77DRAFT_364449 [Pyronema omphalodes]
MNLYKLIWALPLVLPVESATVGKRMTPESGVKDLQPCVFWRPQTALIRDTIYVDGGLREGNIQPSGEWSDRLKFYNAKLYEIDLKVPFSGAVVVKNLSAVIRETESSVIVNQYRNGHMLANHNEFVVYGGLLDDTDTIKPMPPADYYVARYLHSSKELTLAQEQWKVLGLKGLTRYLADGAYVNVPSENKGFIFGGSRASDWGEITGVANLGKAFAANVTTNQLIVAKLGLNRESWENKTVDSTKVPPRTGAELTWLPTGQNGALVAFGGTELSIHDILNGGNDPSVYKNLDKRDQRFMKNVHVYDVSNDKWFTQETTGDIPPPTSDFCSVAVSDKDGKNHQIFIYGGITSYGVLGPNESFDTVYALSIPAFKWTRVYDGVHKSRRHGHRCHKVADNYMMVIGGAPSTAYQMLGNCVESGDLVKMFNLNTLTFEADYNPENADSYKIPKKIVDAVGVVQKPAPGMDTDLGTLLQTQYPGTVKNYWPFAASHKPDTSIPKGDNDSGSGGGSQSSLPKYVPPLLGVILGILGIAIILCSVLFWLRSRKHKQEQRLASDSGASAVVKRRTWSWLMNVNTDEKGDFYAPSESAVKSPVPDSSTVRGRPAHDTSNPVEVPGDGVVHELPDTTVVGELPVRDQRTVTINDNIEEIARDGTISIRPQSPAISAASPLLMTRQDSVLSAVSPVTERSDPQDNSRS